MTKNTKIIFYWGIFFLLMILKNAYYQYTYYPVMDDWIQYGNYSMFDNPFQIILATKMYMVRPLAGISDIYIIAAFWERLNGVFFVITCMHALSAYFFVRVLSYQKIKTGYFFLIIYALLPMGTEATYWISASSRLVVSMFWLSLALFFLCRYLFETQGKKTLLGFFFFQLLSLAYYEPVVVLGLVWTLWILIPHLQKRSGKWLAGITTFNYYLIAVYYQSFREELGQNARASIEFQTGLDVYQETYQSILDLWRSADIYFYMKALRRGTEILWDDRALLYGVCIVLIMYGVFRASKSDRIERKASAQFKKLLLGLILFTAPFAVFFLIQFTWISYRNAFTSFVGLALVLESIMDMLTLNLWSRRLRDVSLACLTGGFLVMNVSELFDYKQTSIIDQTIGKNFIARVDEDAFFSGKKEAVLFNAKRTHTDLNVDYNEHINGITSSDWLLTGSLRGMAYNKNIAQVIPVSTNVATEIFPIDFEKYIFMGMDNEFKMHRLRDVPDGKYAYQLFTENEELFGRLEYRFGMGFFIKE